MSNPEHHNPSELGPAQGLYSQIVTVTTGSLAFLSGQVAVRADGGLVGHDDPERQTRQIFSNLSAALDYLGRPWHSLVRLTSYITSTGHYAAFARARKTVFETYFPDGNYPAHTLLVVQALSAPEHLVEIDAVIALDSAS